MKRFKPHFLQFPLPPPNQLPGHEWAHSLGISPIASLWTVDWDLRLSIKPSNWEVGCDHGKMSHLLKVILGNPFFWQQTRKHLYTVITITWILLQTTRRIWETEGDYLVNCSGAQSHFVWVWCCGSMHGLIRLKRNSSSLWFWVPPSLIQSFFPMASNLIAMASNQFQQDLFTIKFCACHGHTNGVPYPGPPLWSEMLAGI